MADYRKILVLLLEGRSYRDVVEIAGCSHRAVARVSQEIQARGVTAADSVSDADLAGWFPDGRRKVSEEYDQPDLSRVLASMKANRHFTLLLAWRRYVDTKDLGKKYGYSQFCALFTDYVRSHDLVAVLNHEPGRAMLVDWAGDTIELVDAVTGETTKAVLFVAVLPFSGLMFCCAFIDMKSPAWLDAHVQAFAFFGGVPQIIVPDNPTTATNRSHPGDAERVVNARYQQLADHYQCAIVPARVKKPRDKASAENAVNVVNKRVIGYLEDDVFTTLAELNDAIVERVREINHDIRRADGSTRWERFDAEERKLLGSLPDAAFEDVQWKELKAGRNYHVTADTQRYSVPFALAGKLLRVRLTASTVTVFDGNDIICKHPRLTGRKGQYSTLPEHVPPQHRNIDGLWSRRWFTDRARSFGPATVTVIEQILDSQAIEAQGYLACQNILDGLGKNNRQRLDAACQELLNRHGHPTYTTLKHLMATIDSDAKKPKPLIPAASTRKRGSTVVFRDTGPDVYVRDASHYEIGEGTGR
ncbi:IS21 family transposase [Cryobacterium sp. 5B3]|uniref:IS21 family transposase n=1 Tax=Cryobacterium sp. 5B3 TaxID=3048586 RepID=UPI002AB46C6C|nr:IS21 family transposase [Cryobacterium sp. 5B3]MDY7540985.1 IS21 family transposase [Cryobacterium sp. 5B3]MDY7544405.1 IS21 family transposase [Cryobacterium sp. 5B3]